MDRCLRQEHRAGEKLFVDYAGQTVPVQDRRTGELRSAQIFVAVLGASNYTYAEATWTQTLPDWIGSHTRAFAFFGGVTAMIVSDNLKSGITKACFHEPAVNRAYNDWLAERFPRYSWASPSCSSYYQDSMGRTPFLFPGRFKEYAELHNQSGLHEYDLCPAPTASRHR